MKIDGSVKIHFQYWNDFYLLCRIKYSENSDFTIFSLLVWYFASEKKAKRKTILMFLHEYPTSGKL